jgi:hypothetical protein
LYKIVKTVQTSWLALGLVALAAGAARADYSNTVASFQPIAYWRLGETNQPPPGDLASNLGTLGSSADGVYFNGATHPASGALAAGTDTGALFPNVNGNRVRADYSPGLSVNAAFSVEFWANPADVVSGDSDQFQTAVSFFKYGDSGWVVYQHGAAGWTFSLNGANAITTSLNGSQTVTPGTWYHVVAVYDGTQAILYANGQQLGTAAVSSFIPVTDQSIPFTIGARGDGNDGFYRFNGGIDEVAFYTNALTAQEVLAHYQNGTNTSPAQAYPQLVLAGHPPAYYRLDEPAYTPPDSATLPVASNSGSLGKLADGSYEVGTVPGVSGVPYAGLGTSHPAAQFDSGHLSYVDAAGSDVLDLTSSLTVIAWVQPDAANGTLQTVVGKGDQSYRLNFYANGAAGFAAGAGNGDVVGTTRVDDGLWHQVVGVYDAVAGTNYLYVDGLLEGAGAAPNGVAGDSALDVNIGRAPDYTASRYFNGSVDEVAIFDTALTVDQVPQIYYSALVPPWITQQPQAPSTVNAGDPLTLNVGALGTPTLAYQWTLNGAAISGQTAANLVYGAISTANSGAYAVIVTNNYGAVTSSVATVTVESSPIVQQATALATRYVGGTLTLSVTAVGSAPLAYQWYHGTTLIAGATASTYTEGPLQLTDAGSYQVKISNGAGSTNFDVLELTVLPVQSGSYLGTILADAPLAYWHLDETNGSTAYDVINSYNGTYFDVKQGVPGFFAADPDLAAFFGYQINSYVGAITGLDFSNGSSFSVEAWVNGHTNQTGDVGIISKGTGGGEQFDLDTGNGGDYRFGIRTADGTWYATADPGVGPSGTWQHLVATVDNSSGTLALYVNGALVASTSFPQGNLLPSGEPVTIGSRRSGTGAYDLNFYGTVDEPALYPTALTPAQVAAHYNVWLRPGQPPLIAQPPGAASNYVGLAASFAVAAQGDGGLSYQWLQNDSVIVGATQASLTISALDSAAAGAYSVVVTSPYGTTNSVAASLTVLPIPTTIDVSSGLVLHLKFDSQGDYADYSGRGNNASPVGSPTFVPGKIGAEALHYSTLTSQNYLTLGTPADLNFGSNVDFTVSYWLRVAAGSSTSGQVVFGNALYGLMTPGYAFGFAYGPPGAWGFSFNTQDGPNVTGTGQAGAANDGNWHHFVFTMDRKGLVTTYLDGYAVDAELFARIDNLDEAATLIGQTPVGSNSSEADLDDVSVWQRVLSSVEVGAIYTAGNTYGAGVASAPVFIEIQSTGSTDQLIWSGGILQSAKDVTGPYTDVSGATSPYSLAPTADRKFYRLRQ